MAQKQPLDLTYPLRGLNENWAFGAQPDGTTPDCLNVRPYDLAGRMRGGQRPGISKFFDFQIGGGAPIQRLGFLIQSITGEGDQVTTETFTQADGFFDQPAWTNIRFTAGGVPQWSGSSSPYVVGNEILSASEPLPIGSLHNGVQAGENYTLTEDVTISYIGHTVRVGFLVRGAAGYTLPIKPSGLLLNATVQIEEVLPGVLRLQAIVPGGSLSDEPMNTGVSGDYLDTDWWATTRELKLEVVGDDFTLSVEGQELATGTTSTNAGNPITGFQLHAEADVPSGQEVTIDNWTATLERDARLSNREPTLLAVSDGDIYYGDPEVSLSLATGGGSALVTTTDKVKMSSLFTKMYFVDGTNYKVFDNETDTVITWTASVGDLPSVSTNTAGIITTYRSRIVLAGIVGDDQNWFMSKAGDAEDWDYADTTATAAIAGNNATAGKCPDIITCLASINDDLLIMGGDHTLWIMRGDPADGGRIDNVSQQTGIAGPDAYCFDPNGIFYFFGNGSLWKMPPGQAPEDLSDGSLSETLGNINLGNNTVKLIWDQTNHGVHIYVIPREQDVTTHYWWDARTNGFWPDQYPDNQGPTAIMVYDADSPSDRAVLLGGWDSYIRQEDTSAISDDSITILSRVKFAPITPGGAHQNMRVNRITTILGQTSDPITLRAFAAQSPEEVIGETTPVWSMLVTPTARYSIPRIGGNSVLLEIKNDSFSADWGTGIAYAVGDQVVESETPYTCAEAHTAGTFSTDLAAEKWTLSTFRSWSLESLSATMDVTGRTRHGRI